MPDRPPEEIARARAVLARAVAKICPSRLADRREDIVQNALLRVLGSDAGKGSALPGPSYLWRVAYTATVDEIRRNDRRREEPLDAGVDPARLPGRRASGADPEMRRALERQMEALQPARRSAVLLQLLGFSLQESARILGWSAKKVENHRYLGMRDLRRALKAEGFER